MAADSLASGYIIGWCIYLVAALGLIVFFWRMTRGLRQRRTRRVMRAVVATLLLTPVNISPEGFWLAPAYLVASYDFVQGQMETATQAAFWMLISFTTLITLMLIESVGRRMIGMTTKY